MESDGTLTLRLRAKGAGAVGDGQIVYHLGDKDYPMILDHLGAIKIGETVPVKPWPVPKEGSVSAPNAEFNNSHFYRLGEFFSMRIQAPYLLASGHSGKLLDAFRVELITAAAPKPVMDNFDAVSAHIGMLHSDRPYDQWSLVEKADWIKNDPADDSWQKWLEPQLESEFCFLFGMAAFDVSYGHCENILAGASADPAVQQRLVKQLQNLVDMLTDEKYAPALEHLSMDAVSQIVNIEGLKNEIERDGVTVDRCMALRRLFDTLSELASANSLVAPTLAVASANPKDPVRFFDIAEFNNSYSVEFFRKIAGDLPKWIDAFGAELEALEAPQPVMDNHRAIRAWLLSMPFSTPFEEWPENEKSKWSDDFPVDESLETWARQRPETEFFFSLGASSSEGADICDFVIEQDKDDIDLEAFDAMLGILGAVDDLIDGDVFASARARLTPDALATLKAIAGDGVTLERCKNLRDEFTKLSELARAGKLVTQ